MIQNRLLNMSQELNRPLILHGAIGSNLQVELVTNSPLWVSELSLKNPDIVFDLYNKYIDSGCEILTSNTFRTNPYIVEKYSKYKPKDLINKSFEIINSLKKENTIIAACNPPAEDCYNKKRNISYKQLENNHKQHIDLLYQHKVDFILNETFSHLDEIIIVSEYCSKNNIPYIISFFSMNGLNILSGEQLEEVINIANSFNPLAISFNCWKIEYYDNFSSNNKNELNYKNGFYFNCGNGCFHDNIIETGVSPLDYLNMIKRYINKNTLFIGSCCGSTPEHTKELRRYYDKKN